MFATIMPRAWFQVLRNKKRASYLNHSAQPSTLAAFPPWGNSRGATCLRLAPHKDTTLSVCVPCLCLEILLMCVIKNPLSNLIRD